MITVHRCYGMMKVYKIRRKIEWNKPLNFEKKHVGGEGNRDFFPAVLSLLFADCQNGGAEVSFWPLPQNLAMLISLCMVHCVGMFAFLSVYGLTLSMKSKYPEYDFDGHTATLFVLKRYVKLVLTF